MVEVFKTNVESKSDADRLVNEIHRCHGSYDVNFDLDDCDKILRVKCEKGVVDPFLIIHLLRRFEFQAEVLPDLPCLRYHAANTEKEFSNKLINS